MPWDKESCKQDPKRWQLSENKNSTITCAGNVIRLNLLAAIAKRLFTGAGGSGKSQGAEGHPEVRNDYFKMSSKAHEKGITNFIVWLKPD